MRYRRSYVLNNLILGKIFLYLGQREFVQCEETNDQIHGVVYSKVNKKRFSTLE